MVPLNLSNFHWFICISDEWKFVATTATNGPKVVVQPVTHTERLPVSSSQPPVHIYIVKQSRNMSTNRSKRVWQQHEDALAVLEDANDVDTRRQGPAGFAVGMGPMPTATNPELIELERKRVALETRQTTSLRVIAGIMTSILLITFMYAFFGEEAKAIGGDGPEVLSYQDLRKMKKSLGKLAGIEAVKNIMRDVLSTTGADPFEDPKKRAKSILMFGPPGCGKTEIAKAAAADMEYNYIEVTGGKIIGSYVGQSAKAIRSYFNKAKASAPCVLFFDEVETLLKARGKGDGGGGQSENDRTVSEFLTEMNAIFDSDTRVIVVGATNLPESLDSAAVRRFHRRVYIPVPGEKARIALFEKEFKSAFTKPLNAKQYKELAEMTYGYSSSNINDCSGIILKHFRTDSLRRMNEAQRKQLINSKSTLKLNASFEGIKQAAKKCRSTTTSSSLAAYRQWANQFGEKAEEEDKPKEGEIRPITAFDLDDEEKKMAEYKVRPPAKTSQGLDDLVGLKTIKDRLLDATVQMVRRAEEARAKKFEPIKNFLLYGPPGTGKSRLAEALAKSALEKLKNDLGDKTVSFIAISAADVKGKYIGESEKNLNRWFRIAEAYQPSVLFIDEMETLLINRNSPTAGADGGAGASILGTFLQLTDGPNVDPGRQVIIIGATNHPKNLDSAALRRFEALHIPLPDSAARKEFFARGIYKQPFTKLKQATQRSIETLAEKSEGYSGSDISNILKVARNIRDREIASNGGKLSFDAPIQGHHLVISFALVKPSATKEDIEECNNFQGESQEVDVDELLKKYAPEQVKVKSSVPAEKNKTYFESLRRLAFGSSQDAVEPAKKSEVPEKKTTPATPSTTAPSKPPASKKAPAKKA